MDYSLLGRQYNLSSHQIDFYRKNGFVKLKHIFDSHTLYHFGRIIQFRVNELGIMQTPLHQRDTYSKAFLQIMNLWTKDEEIRKFVFCKRLAAIATELIGVDGVRLYHDQALFKEPGGGYTPWHADQFYWPLNSDKCITAWIPLQPTSLNMGPLEFSAGSHRILEGRNTGISDGSEMEIDSILKDEDVELVVEPFELGEVSFHSGWTFHRAGPNRTNEMRKVMTIIYMDKDIRLKSPENENQVADWKAWCPGAEIGQVIDTPMNPVIFDLDDG